MDERLRVVVDGDGNAERETPAQPPGRQPQRLRTRKPLPTDRAKFATQTDALRAFVRASNRGEEAVGAAEVAARISITEATAGLVNSFFVEAGFLTKEGKGRYKPVAAVNEYTRLHSFDPEKAQKQLAQPLRTSWYFTEVASELQGGPATEDTLINVLALAAGAEGDRRPQLELVLDWLEYAGLIVRDNGNVRLADQPETDADASGESGQTADTQVEPETPVTKSKGATKERGNAPQVIGFSFEFSLTADDLRKLTPEQITATFEAVGKVMAIKAAME
jgi:hypothetical protein